ncbi:MAG: thioredoxin [Clostridia bacterium]|nr:thioredoxin [Clostridia bacterium]
MRNINSSNNESSVFKLISNNQSNESAVQEVTSNTFENEVLRSDKKVLVDFYATWCGPCQVLSPIVDEVAMERNDVKFVRIDVDKNDDLASEYGIYSIPTLVVIENGKESNRSIGLIDKSRIVKLIDN